ncbi:phage conserved hypothetical protein, phiE125 gp8 family [Ketogulonicigenium robustum]|uniref:Phage gp6-like head-tail connector protein n=1 Tax=Ketogulonicigenium robustum TaxID=92947 RepID=A0A1W6NYM4_9RHOB|nr:head-tail connector protein [Ketogulonicigenium robustum]ARO14271.1 phage conserved hypothetical protein, phiE125 gp8 family [Ketogulonicigenium robustum]
MMLVEETTVADAALPVAALGDFLRLGTGFDTDNMQEGLLRAFLRAALAAVEGRIGKILIARTFREDLAPPAALSALPLREVIAVTANGAPVDWQVQQGLRPRVTLRGWQTDQQLSVRYIAGMAADWETLPADIQQAVLMLAAHYYEYREDPDLDGACMPFGVSALTERYRTVRLGFGGAQ